MGKALAVPQLTWPHTSTPHSYSDLNMHSKHFSPLHPVSGTPLLSRDKVTDPPTLLNQGEKAGKQHHGKSPG